MTQRSQKRRVARCPKCKYQEHIYGDKFAVERALAVHWENNHGEVRIPRQSTRK